MNTPHLLRLTLPALLALAPTGTSLAAPITFNSGARPASLLELYTSEGCSSCPPAEAWLSRLKDAAGLWTDVVPVAFHVDYWNNLGWTDPWSQEAFSDRQREYARLWSSQNIYTPEFVLNGAEWQRPYWGTTIPQNHAANPGTLTVSSEDGQRWSVRYVLPDGTVPAQRICELYAALLVSGVSSEVKAGENAGRHLAHDFAALRLQDQPLVSKTNEFKGTFTLALPAKPTGGRLALAVWVCDNGKTAPAQVLGGWLP